MHPGLRFCSSAVLDANTLLVRVVVHWRNQHDQPSRVANGKTSTVFSWRNSSPVRWCPLQLHEAFSSTFEAWPYSTRSYSIQYTFGWRQKGVIGGGMLCDSCHVNTLFCVQCWVSLPSCLCIFLFSRNKLFFVDEVVYIAGNSDTTAFVLSLRK